MLSELKQNIFSNGYFQISKEHSFCPLPLNAPSLCSCLSLCFCVCMKRMEDAHCLTINGEERNGDEFYEHIEAPKFVDLNAPDSHHPGDDRYWFCLRVGCDQKHEEELDPEAIDKNFVLRVMAARSPNIRLRKALYRKDSTKVKCPQSVPPKLSKPRISRLALITSMSKRMADPKVSVNPHSKHHKTPNTKLKQSSVRTKAQTTPANKKGMPNPDAFRSVRNPKVGPVLVPKNKVVAKALVFHSPKKRLKTSLELKTPVKTLCDAMKKLQVTSAKKHVLGYDRPLPSDVPRKQLRGREVKSRVYDGLRCQKGKGQDAKSSKCMKGQKEVKNLWQHRSPLTHEGTENDSSDMEIEEKSRKRSLVEVISNPQGDEGNANAGILMTAEVPKASMNDNRDVGLQSQSNLAENDPRSLQSSNCEGNGICEGKSQIEKTESCLKTNIDGNDKENNGEVMEIDDKENNSVSDDNRHCDVNTSHLGKKVRSRQNPKDTQVVRTMKKSSKESSDMDAQEWKNKKSKPTNPRPFRLRTDERAVKEANLKKKPLKEITPFSRFPQGNTERKRQSAIETSVKNREQSECGNQTCETNDKTPNTTRTDQPVSHLFIKAKGKISTWKHSQLT
ncbi:hypothetical protein K2173_023901 [Erythroxylum novogranatense]|uniref:Uncharacterized protein n=1 Tax=Erythroxylum novogranatense TaxID=1862640 RepID=A0AAV8TPS4_9ROSI|nr:hypothetical protein K2173_023901 [Erythroxylum novogranatense]